MLPLRAQLYPALCDPMGCSPPGSSVRGILQTGILEWVEWDPGVGHRFYSRDLPDPGIEPTSLASGALAGRFFIAVNINIFINRYDFKAYNSRRPWIWEQREELSSGVLVNSLIEAMRSIEDGSGPTL